MPDVLVPVGRHFFTPQQLNEAVARIQPNAQYHGGLLATVDSDGAKVALMWTNKDGNLAIRTAYAHDWTGEDKVAGDVLWRF